MCQNYMVWLYGMVCIEFPDYMHYADLQSNMLYFLAILNKNSDYSITYIMICNETHIIMKPITFSTILIRGTKGTGRSFVCYYYSESKIYTNYYNTI